MRPFLFFLLTVLMFTAFAQSEETEKSANLSSMSDSWRYLNAFDAEKYVEQKSDSGNGEKKDKKKE